MAGDEENVSDDRQSGTGDDEGCPSLRLVREHGDGHGYDEGKNIGRSREQLRLGGGITQFSDDGGEEEIECINRQAHGVETEAVEVDLWILERFKDTSPGELLVSGGITIMFEPCDNVFPLLGSEETGSRGVIIDEEVCGDGDGDSHEALLEQC